MIFKKETDKERKTRKRENDEIKRHITIEERIDRK